MKYIWKTVGTKTVCVPLFNAGIEASVENITGAIWARKRKWQYKFMNTQGCAHSKKEAMLLVEDMIANQKTSGVETLDEAIERTGCASQPYAGGIQVFPKHDQRMSFFMLKDAVVTASLSGPSLLMRRIPEPPNQIVKWAEQHSFFPLPKRYLVVPGNVVSKQDGQRHFVGFFELIKLYGVNIDDCRCAKNESDMPVEGQIVLAPRYDGNYTLPKE